MLLRRFGEWMYGCDYFLDSWEDSPQAVTHNGSNYSRWRDFVSYSTIHILVMIVVWCWSFTMSVRCTWYLFGYTIFAIHHESVTGSLALGYHRLGQNTWSSLDDAFCGSSSHSVHLLKEFVGGVFIAVVLHFVELSFLRAQHGIDLLRDTSAQVITHRLHLNSANSYLASKHNVRTSWSPSELW